MLYEIFTQSSKCLKPHSQARRFVSTHRNNSIINIPRVRIYTNTSKKEVAIEGPRVQGTLNEATREGPDGNLRGVNIPLPLFGTVALSRPRDYVATITR